MSASRVKIKLIGTATSVRATCLAAPTRGLVGFCFLLISGSSLPAAEFVTDKTTLLGEIIRSSDSMVTIKLDVGSIIMVPPGDIREVTVSIDDDTSVSGRLVDWQAGTYTLEGPDGLVLIDDGELTRLEPIAVPPLPAGNSSPADDDVIEEQPDVALEQPEGAEPSPPPKPSPPRPADPPPSTTSNSRVTM